MAKLDKYDHKILYELDKQSNLQINLLAKKLRKSKQFVLYRIQRLQEDKIITNFTAIVDMSKLGYFSFRVYFKLQQVTDEDCQHFIDFVKQNYPKVWTITSIHGKWDYALFLGVKNIVELHSIWDSILLRFKSKIKHYNVAVYAPIYNFNRTFFMQSTEEVITRVYGEGDLALVDKLDWDIIQAYAPDVRQSSLELGKRLGVSADTIRARIKKMEFKKVICGYKIGLDLQRMGYSGYRVDIELISTSKNKLLFEFCKQHKNIYQINKSIGGADFEIEVVVKDTADLQRVIKELTLNFKEVINDIEYFGFSTFHMLNYIPD